MRPIPYHLYEEGGDGDSVQREREAEKQESTKELGLRAVGVTIV